VQYQISGCETSTSQEQHCFPRRHLMEERAMSSKIIGLALTVGLVVASVALPLETNSAAAAGRNYRAQGTGAVGHWQDSSGLDDYAGPGGVYGPGFGAPYIFVPGLGILDAPCGLPTSACPNSERPAD
jgi:hypothetical protein